MIETRGRKQIIGKESILEILLDKKWHTNAEIATELDVCPATIRSRIKEIARDGYVVLMGADGYRLMNQEDITDEDAALAVATMTRWMLNIVARQAMAAKPMKRLMNEARRLLPKTAEERVIVRKYLVQLTHLIDFQDIEDIG